MYFELLDFLIDQYSSMRIGFLFIFPPESLRDFGVTKLDVLGEENLEG